MKRKIFSTMALVLGGTLLCLAMVADITGKWVGKLQTPNGEMPLTYEFKTDAGKLTGTVATDQGATNITDGKATESELSFSVDYNGMEVKHKGKIYADSIALDLSVNGQQMHCRLTRAPQK